MLRFLKKMIRRKTINLDYSGKNIPQANKKIQKSASL